MKTFETVWRWNTIVMGEKHSTTDSKKWIPMLRQARLKTTSRALSVHSKSTSSSRCQNRKSFPPAENFVPVDHRRSDVHTIFLSLVWRGILRNSKKGSRREWKPCSLQDG